MDRDDCKTWDVDQVAAFFDDIGISSSCVEAVRKNKVDGAMLLKLIEEDDGLEELGVNKKVDRAKITSRLIPTSPNSRASKSPARTRDSNTAVVQAPAEKERELKKAASKEWEVVKAFNREAPTTKVVDLIYDYDAYYSPIFFVVVYPSFLAIIAMVIMVFRDMNRPYSYYRYQPTLEWSLILSVVSPFLVMIIGAVCASYRKEKDLVEDFKLYLRMEDVPMTATNRMFKGDPLMQQKWQERRHQQQREQMAQMESNLTREIRGRDDVWNATSYTLNTMPQW